MRRSQRRAICLLASCLLLGCARKNKEDAGESPPPTRAASSAREAAPALEPKRLIALPASAYATSLALDDDAAYLLTPRAAFRLVPDQPPQGIELELGIGPALTRSAFIFWSKGAIWRAPKSGGVTEAIAKLDHQPQYFVASDDDFAWVDASESGIHTIQTLEGKKPRVLVSAVAEISALNMVKKAIYFVERPTDTSWRLGVVAVSGGDPRYAAPKKGRRPALLTGTDDLYYYDLDESEIRRRSLDLAREDTRSPKLVCSPIYVASAIYCGSVEGLFEVSKESKQPRVLVQGRPGSISNVAANSRMVAWTVDVGADKLEVYMLPASNPQ